MAKSRKKKPAAAKQRKLLALFFCDMVGYGALSNTNETLAIELLEEYRALLRRIYPFYGGRENKTIGDAFFLEFGSVVEAVRCAIEIQTRLYERNLVQSKERQIHIRIGIHLGDVISFDRDRFGDGVNIASHIESYATPDGVCISRQVADQLYPYEDIKLKKRGSQKLKNFSVPTELHEVVLPWQEGSGFRFLSKLLGKPKKEALKWSSPKNLVLHGATLVVLLMFGVFIARAVHKSAKYKLSHFQSPERSIASSKAPKISLKGDWNYALPEGIEAKRVIDDPSTLNWLPKIKNNWDQADKLVSPFWMTRNFDAEYNYQHPALILGIVSGAYRAYLNGSFIGGSNHLSGVFFSSFDSSLLKKEGNVLLVQINPKPSLIPGITHFPALGSFVGEFNEVYTSVVNNQYYYHVVQSVYLAIAFLLFIVCLIYYSFNRSQKQYLYFSTFLLLGCMSILYYNGLITGFLDYRYQRFCKLFSLVLSSLVLCSTYLHLRKQEKLEIYNNILAFLWSGFLVSILVRETSAANFVEFWNLNLEASINYTLLWFVGITAFEANRWITLRKRPNRKKRRTYYGVLVMAFGFLTILSCYSSLLKDLPLLEPWPAARPTLKKIGILSPFLFAFSLAIAAALDYVSKTKMFFYKKTKDDLILNLVGKLVQNPKLNDVIRYVQDQVVRFVKAERSTIYLLTKEKGNECLKADFILGLPQAKHKIKKIIRPKDGIIGYVWNSRSPILIRDLGKDLRFKEHLKGRKARSSSYRTGSCMIFPLVISNRLVGILTVADKKNEESFSREDFSLLHIVAKDLALLIDNNSLKEELKNYAA